MANTFVVQLRDDYWISDMITTLDTPVVDLILKTPDGSRTHNLNNRCATKDHAAMSLYLFSRVFH